MNRHERRSSQRPLRKGQVIGLPNACASHQTHLVTMSKPGEVAIAIEVDGHVVAWVGGPALSALGDAWAILDTTRRALEKAGEPVPERVTRALELLASDAKELNSDPAGLSKGS